MPTKVSQLLMQFSLCYKFKRLIKMSQLLMQFSLCYNWEGKDRGRIQWDRIHWDGDGAGAGADANSDAAGS